jgi:hypothetical protein
MVDQRGWRRPGRRRWRVLHRPMCAGIPSSSTGGWTGHWRPTFPRGHRSGSVGTATSGILVHWSTVGISAHDLIRLALSLSSAARGSNLPGVTTARMIEAIMDGYQSAFEHDFDETEDSPKSPHAVKVVMRRAAKRTWKHLAKERLEDTRPKILLGRRFWPISEEERDASPRSSPSAPSAGWPPWSDHGTTTPRWTSSTLPTG